MEVVVLALPRALGGLPAQTSLTALGPDRMAILPTDRDQMLYDFGLGMASSAFCIRTSDPDLGRALNEHIGRAWPDVLAGIGRQVVQVSPTRVALSPVGRSRSSPTFPHLEDTPTLARIPTSCRRLVLGRETPPGLELPAHLIPCAIFYPGPELSGDQGRH